MRQTKDRFKVFEMSRQEMMDIFNSPCHCDWCCAPSETMYYICVLNRGYCEQHYKEWLKRAVFHPEDVEYETLKYEDLLKRTKDGI